MFGTSCQIRSRNGKLRCEALPVPLRFSDTNNAYVGFLYSTVSFHILQPVHRRRRPRQRNVDRLSGPPRAQRRIYGKSTRSSTPFVPLAVCCALDSHTSISRSTRASAYKTSSFSLEVCLTQKPSLCGVVASTLQVMDWHACLYLKCLCLCLKCHYHPEGCLYMQAY